MDFAAAIKKTVDAGDVVGSFFINPATDTGPIEDVVWAEFKAVPEPGTLLLTAVATAATLVRYRRLRHR